MTVFEKQGRDALNTDRMIRKFIFVTADDMHF